MDTTLDGIAAEAAATDAAVSGAPGGDAGAAPGAPGGAPGAEAPPGGAATAALLVGFIKTLVGIAGKRFPSILAVWTDAAVSQVADALAPILDKYGLATPEFLERWKVELSALMLCGPLVFATIAAVRADLAAEGRGKEKDVTPKGGEPGSAGNPL